MHLGIHVLHTVPYSNLNRDALGSPKSCTYGGTVRSRVSSQSWKRAVRHQVEDELGARTLRTRRLATALRQHLTRNGWDEDTARKAGRAVLIAAADKATKSDSGGDGGILPGDADDAAGVLMWLPASIFDDLTELCAQHREAIAATTLPQPDETSKKPRGKKRVKDPLGDPVLPPQDVVDILARRSPTINLLGRMLAELPTHNVDGAVSFAHAFTTHEVANDFDFFTAVDDLPDPNHRGSGHMAIAEFTSGTFYRYSSIDLDQFAAHLGGNLDDALRVIDVYLRAFCTAMPGGKQAVTAATTAPDLVHLTLRHAPLSLAPAFETPIRSTGGFIERSQEALDTYAGAVTRFLGAPSVAAGYASAFPTGRDHLGDRHESIGDLIQAITNAASDHAEAAA